MTVNSLNFESIILKSSIPYLVESPFYLFDLIRTFDFLADCHIRWTHSYLIIFLVFRFASYRFAPLTSFSIIFLSWQNLSPFLRWVLDDRLRKICSIWFHFTCRHHGCHLRSTFSYKISYPLLNLWWTIFYLFYLSDSYNILFLSFICRDFCVILYSQLAKFFFIFCPFLVVFLFFLRTFLSSYISLFRLERSRFIIIVFCKSSIFAILNLLLYVLRLGCCFGIITTH